MLPGFEEETMPLTNKEQTLYLPIIVNALRKKIGRENAVTSKQIIEGMATRSLKISGPRVRALINTIRSLDLVPGLIANHAGYYISTDPGEVKDYVESLRRRCHEIKKIQLIMEQYEKTLK